MKKIVLSIAALSLLINISNAQDKAFKKGDITAGLGVGFGLYGTKLHSEATYGSIKVVDDTTDGAVSVIYPLMAEYGVTDWFGVGARFAYSNYFEERDSITNIKPKVNAFDLGLALNFHLVKSKHFDMPISLLFGYSNFKIHFNDPTNQIGKDNGLNYGIMLTPRIYFGDHIGMFFNIGYLGYNYPSIQFSNNTDSNLNDNNNWLFKLKGNGANLGIGLTAKF